MQWLEIRGYSYTEGHGLLPTLTSSLAQSGAWITDRNTISPTRTELCFEIQLRSSLELYMALVQSGIELTRTAHLAMTDLLTCYNNLDASHTADQVVAIRLEIDFLEDVTLHALLTTGVGFA